MALTPRNKAIEGGSNDNDNKLSSGWSRGGGGIGANDTNNDGEGIDQICL